MNYIEYKNIYILKYEYLIHILFNPIHPKISFQYVINIFKLLRYSTFVGGLFCCCCLVNPECVLWVLFFVYLAMPCGLWDLSFQTRD